LVIAKLTDFGVSALEFDLGNPLMEVDGIEGEHVASSPSSRKSGVVSNDVDSLSPTLRGLKVRESLFVPSLSAILSFDLRSFFSFGLLELPLCLAPLNARQNMSKFLKIYTHLSLSDKPRNSGRKKAKINKIKQTVLNLFRRTGE
jgi:hypothetical protein